jgi:hypothetical protein
LAGQPTSSALRQEAASSARLSRGGTSWRGESKQIVKAHAEGAGERQQQWQGSGQAL